MDINKISVDDLEKMSHLDIAYSIIKYNKEPKTTIELLKNICTLLKYNDSMYESLIGDFYTSLNLDKRFILIDGKWDLSEKHVVNVIIEDELDEYEEDMEELEDEEIEETEDDAVLDETDALEDVEDDLDDDIEDLTIVDEDELDEENDDTL